MTYHIIIKEERRLPKETPFGLDDSRLAKEHGGQLHTHSDDNLKETDWTDAQFVMVIEWDLKSPFVTEHKGKYSDRMMQYFGWPDITEKEYVPPAGL